VIGALSTELDQNVLIEAGKRKQNAIENQWTRDTRALKQTMLLIDWWVM
jgi:hypothetical protein